MAVSMQNRAPLKGVGAPLKGVGVDTNQVWSRYDHGNYTAVSVNSAAFFWMFSQHGPYYVQVEAPVLLRGVGPSGGGTGEPQGTLGSNMSSGLDRSLAAMPAMWTPTSTMPTCAAAAATGLPTLPTTGAW